MTSPTGLTNGVVNAYIEKLGVHRFGISLAAGTFSITAANGVALGMGNPAYVTLSDKTNVGQYNAYVITSGWSFTDASGTSDITGNTFGNPTGVATGERTFYIYLVVDDAGTGIQAMISDDPNATLSPVAAAIAAPDDAVATAQGDFWSMDNITEADWESNPCVKIGSFRMSMDGSDDWTVAALTSDVGIDKYPAVDPGNSWVEITATSASLAVNTGYNLNNAGLVTATLPLIAAVGDVIRVIIKGAGLGTIAQNAGQTIHLGSSSTTTGVGGSLAAVAQWDSIELRCVTANTDFASMGGPQGSWTVV